MNRTKLFLGMSVIAFLGFILFLLTIPSGTLGINQGMALENPATEAPMVAPPDVPVVNKVGRVTLIEFFAGF